MRILVIGSGGREHALVWKITQSDEPHTVFAAPGNAGIASLAECVPLSVNDLDALIEFAAGQSIDLVVVGPEAPLAEGLADRCRSGGIPVFGPGRAAARLESSKIFSKEFCGRHGIPTAAFEICQSPDAVRASAASRDNTCVVKADGLAAGKGVFVCRSAEDVESAIDAMFIARAFGDAAQRVIVEDCLVGEEASILALVDGHSFRLLESSQDHKAAYEGDTGPNTGGMGAYSPAPVITPALKSEIETRIIEPVVRGMKAEGHSFAGILYAGLMIVDGEPQVLEFNVRFGDPETQPILMRMASDIVPYLMACSQGTLDQLPPLHWHDEPAVCVVLASGGYPGSYTKGYPITGLNRYESTPSSMIFHAGTAFNPDRDIVTSGGRVLGVTAMGATVQAACRRVYDMVHSIHFKDMYYRKDIAHRALNR